MVRWNAVVVAAGGWALVRWRRRWRCWAAAYVVAQLSRMTSAPVAYPTCSSTVVTAGYGAPAPYYRRARRCRWGVGLVGWSPPLARSRRRRRARTGDRRRTASTTGADRMARAPTSEPPPRRPRASGSDRPAATPACAADGEDGG